MNNKLLLCFFLLTTLSCCAYIENSYDEVDLFLAVLPDSQLELRSGLVERIDVSEAVVYKVKFDSVQGGETRLFGLIKLREANGYSEKRLTLFDENNNVIKRFSVEDLQELEISTISGIEVVDLRE